MRQTFLSKTFVSSGNMSYLSHRARKIRIFFSFEGNATSLPSLKHNIPSGRRRFKYSREETQIQKPLSSPPLGTPSETVCGQRFMFCKSPIEKRFLLQLHDNVFPQDPSLSRSQPAQTLNKLFPDWISNALVKKEAGLRGDLRLILPSSLTLGHISCELGFEDDSMRSAFFVFFWLEFCQNYFTWICYFARISTEITNPEHYKHSPVKAQT